MPLRPRAPRAPLTGARPRGGCCGLAAFSPAHIGPVILQGPKQLPSSKTGPKVDSLEIKNTFLWTIIDEPCDVGQSQANVVAGQAGGAVRGHDPHCQETKNILIKSEFILANRGKFPNIQGSFLFPVFFCSGDLTGTCFQSVI